MKRNIAPNSLEIIIFGLTLAYVCCKKSAPVAYEDEVQKAIKFMKEIDQIEGRLLHDTTVVEYEHATNVSDVNSKKFMAELEKIQRFHAASIEKARTFKWNNFKRKHRTLYRWFRLFIQQQPTANIYPVDKTEPKLDQIYNTFSVCAYKSRHKNCTLKINPDLINIFGVSRNPFELRYYWSQAREVGKRMRKTYIAFVEDANKNAKTGGFKDFGKVWIKDYESRSFPQRMAESMEEIRPLYEQLHAYVRVKMSNFYKKSHIKSDGPIPAHLLGNIDAQTWLNVFDIVNPFPNKKTANVTGMLIKWNMEPLDMYIMAEEFYESIGFDRMTPYFWRRSLIEKPLDRDVMCQGTAYDFHDGKDYRIKYCTQINEEGLGTVLHEMGHIHYFMMYKNQPTLFQLSPNAGFHESMGDTFILSLKTFDFLQKKGFVDADVTNDHETDILILLQNALRYLASIPYAYIVDAYRYRVFNGSIKPEELNKMWWQYRFQYQGVCPPVVRTEEHFDVGVKTHVAENIEYMRYFFANIFQFQIHKAMCEEIAYKGPLHRCNIYNNKKAGDLLKKIMKLGNSKPWQEVVQILTGGKQTALDTGPILEYYQPLFEWLKKENKHRKIGWKSENVMKCPSPKQKDI